MNLLETLNKEQLLELQTCIKKRFVKKTENNVVVEDFSTWFKFFQEAIISIAQEIKNEEESFEEKYNIDLELTYGKICDLIIKHRLKQLGFVEDEPSKPYQPDICSW